MANLLGKEGNGIYSVAFGIYNVVLTLSSYSLPLVVSKLVSSRLAKKEYKNSYRVLKCALCLAVFAGIVAAVFLYFGSNIIENVYGTPGLNKPLKVMAPTVLIVAVLGVFRGYYQGCATMMPTAISQIIEQIVNAVVSVLAVWVFINTFAESENVAAYGAAGGTIGTLVGAFMALLFLVFVFILYKSTVNRQNRRDHANSRETSHDIYKILLMTMVPIIFSQTIYQIAYTLDDLIFSNFMEWKGMSDSVRISLQGVFNSQYTLLINVPVAIATAMAASIIPNIVISKEQGKKEEMYRKIATVIKFVMVIAFPSAIGLAVLANPLMHLLFPNLTEYNGVAVKLLEWGAVAIVFYSLSTITTAVLQGLDYMRIPVVNVGISLSIHLLMIAVLLYTTNLNIYALLIGDVTFPLIVSLLNWRSIARNTGYHQEIIRTFLVPFGLSIIMGIATHFVYNLLFFIIPLNIVSTLIAIVFAVLVYGYLILRTHCFTAEELHTMGL